nr:copper amine oxidase N-terminal domain-containing protein [uncultured Oscillibacter sp.]
MIKRTFYAVMLISILSVWYIKPVYAADISIFVDNVPAYSEVSPFYKDDTLLVPARLVSEELGATVDWKNEQIDISGNDCKIVLYVGQNQANVNGTSQNLSAPPQIVQGRLFVPLRFIGETLGADVLYRYNKVFIYSQDYKNSADTSNKMQREGVSYTLNGNGTVSIQNLENQTLYLLPTDRFITKLLAISRSGLVYASYTEVYYYSYNDNKTYFYFERFPDLNSPHFTKTGQFFYKKASVSQIPYHSAIFCRDVDGENEKEIIVEREHYGIGIFQIYDDWIYYQEMVPVKEANYATNTCGINRVRLDGTGWQNLIESKVELKVCADWYVDVDGLHYRFSSNKEYNVLSFNEMK